MLVDVHAKEAEESGGYLLGPPDHAQWKELRLKHLSSSQSGRDAIANAKMDTFWLIRPSLYGIKLEYNRSVERTKSLRRAPAISICYQYLRRMQPGGKTYETYVEVPR